MPNTYTLISSVTVGAGGAASIDFTSIPQTYTDLCLKLSARNDASNVAGGVWIQFNGATTNLSSRLIYGYGSGVGSATSASTLDSYDNANSSTASTFGNAEFYIPNYAGSNNKSVSIDSVLENNATEGRQMLTAGLWASTSAITSIKLLTFNNSNSAAANFVQYSTAYLYGVKNA